MVFENVDQDKISQVESQVRQMLDKQMEMSFLRRRDQTAAVSFPSASNILKSKAEKRGKRMFKESYIKMRQELDRQMEESKEKCLNDTV